MDRKYRQRGYQDVDRERSHGPSARPKSPGGPKGAAGRVETRFQLVTRCNNCAAEIQVTERIEANDKCRSCSTDLHTCRNCLHFDPAARNECIKPVEVRITNKSTNNICALFEPKVLVEKAGGGAAATTAPARVENSHRQAFLDLFKK